MTNKLAALESLPMRALRRFGADRYAWPLRRLHVPVTSDALVLEVGSGGNPFPRSNVLLDAYEVTRERHFEALVSDRPTVIGLAEKMPFKDDAFDFVIACHVIEHSLDIHAFISELQRVGRAGYIECPDAMFERLNPYLDHRYEITERAGVLHIRPKERWRDKPDVSDLFNGSLQKSPHWHKHVIDNAFWLHVRYFWSRDAGGIRYFVDGGAKWQDPESSTVEPTAPARPPGLRTRMQHAARKLLSQSNRNRALDIRPLLQCPSCKSGLKGTDTLTCIKCRNSYEFRGGVWQFLSPTQTAY